MYNISEQIEDLKTAVISTIGNAQNREIARGVIKYRRLTDFLTGLELPDIATITQSDYGFDELLKLVDIVNIKEISGTSGSMMKTALIKSDNTFYELRMSQNFISKISRDWQTFISLPKESRQVIFEAISDMGSFGPGVVRYRKENFDDYYGELISETKETNALNALIKEGILTFDDES